MTRGDGFVDLGKSIEMWTYGITRQDRVPQGFRKDVCPIEKKDMVMNSGLYGGGGIVREGLVDKIVRKNHVESVNIVLSVHDDHSATLICLTYGDRWVVTEGCQSGNFRTGEVVWSGRGGNVGRGISLHTF